MRAWRAWALFTFIAVSIIACSSATTPPPAGGQLALGTWGSDSAGMIVGDTSMHLHIKCTFGDVSGRIQLGATGQFDVAGSYVLRAYPIAIGPPLPARFTGQVAGAEATVTVTVNDTVQKQTVVLGPAVVVFKVQAKLWPCPICRRPISSIRGSGQRVTERRSARGLRLGPSLTLPKSDPISGVRSWDDESRPWDAGTTRR